MFKFLFSAMVLGFGSAAMACPDLAGTFLCEDSLGQPAWEHTWTQFFDGAGNTVYANGENSNNVAADGIMRAIQFTGGYLVFKAACVGTDLVIENTTHFDDGKMTVASSRNYRNSSGQVISEVLKPESWARRSHVLRSFRNLNQRRGANSAATGALETG